MTKKVGHLSALERHVGQSALMIGTVTVYVKRSKCQHSSRGLPGLRVTEIVFGNETSLT